MRTAAPTREDGVARQAAELVGGPAGRRVAPGPHGWWHAGRVLPLLTLPTLVLALLVRQPCRAGGFSSPQQLAHACYSDVPALAGTLAEGGAPTEPVGTSLLLVVLAWLAPGGPSAPVGVFDVAVLVLAVALVVTVVATARLAGSRPWDAALVALSPVVVVSGLVSLDLVAVALATCAVLSLAGGRHLGAGLLIGLAVAVRPTALLVLLAVVMVSARAGRWTSAGRVVVAAAVAWVAVNAPAALADGERWAAARRATLELDVGYGSLWMLPRLVGAPPDPALVRWGVVVSLVVVVGGVLLMTLGAARRPRLPAVVLVLVVGVLIVSPSVPVQASLWLLPFAALAVPRWRDHLLWAGAEAAYVTGTWLYLYGLDVPDRGLPSWAYGALLVLRLAAMGGLAWQALRVVHDPATDPVRSPVGEVPARDDPTVGDVEGAADVLVVRRHRPTPPS